MGDGPAYDFHYARAAESAVSKKLDQKKRSEMLHAIMASVGFGENDGNLSLIEQEAAKNLRMAYELFGMLSR